MSRGKIPPPSAETLKLKRELDAAKREILRMKRAMEPAPDASAATAATPATATPAASVTPAAPAPATPVAQATGAEIDALRAKAAELEEARERLSKLYATQLEENRKRAQKLQHILRVVSDINSDLDPATLLERIAGTIQEILGFRIVLIRVREPGTALLRARAFAGLDQDARAQLEAEDVPLDDFLSWLKDDFKVSHSYYISHKDSFNRSLPRGHTADLGPRQDWEWHEDDVLLVPLYNREGELTAYFSVDDPVDRMVPPRETIEMLEMFGNHAVVAIENARL
jgi:hypothetical protein